MDQDGSSFVTTEEEEFETVSSSVEIIKQPVTAAAVPPSKRTKDGSSDLSSLSSSEEGGKAAAGAARGRATGGSSSVSLSDSAETVKKAAAAEAPSRLVVRKEQSSGEGEGEEMEEEEEYGEEGTESSEKISSVESSDHVVKSPGKKAAASAPVQVSLADAAPTAVPVTAAATRSAPVAVVSAVPAVSNTCGPIKCPLEGPIEVDIEDLARICRCGQASKFPYCDNTCESYNATCGTSYGYWNLDPALMGSTIYVCGCGKSARRNVGLPLCDYACRPDENVLVKVTVAGKPPSWQDEPVKPMSVAPVSRSAPAAAAVTPEPVAPRSAPVGVPPAVAATQEPVRPASVVIKVVDKLRDSVASTDGDDEDEEGETFSSEEESTDAVKTAPHLPVAVVEARPVERQANAVVAQESDDDSELAREEERTLQRERQEQAAAQRREEMAAEAMRKAEDSAKAKIRVDSEAAEADRKRAAQTERQRQQEAEEKRAAKARDDADREAAASAAAAAANVVNVADDAKCRKAAIFAEEMRLQEQHAAARAERIRADEEQMKQRQMRERDAAAANARRAAAEHAAARRRNEPQQQQMQPRSAAVVVAEVAVDPKAEADRRTPLFRTVPDALVDNDLFDSSEEPIYLAWEEGAEQRSRAFGWAVSAGPEVVYVSHWDPTSAGVRFLVAKKGLPVRVVAALPPGYPPTTHVLDVFPLMLLSDGTQVRGCGPILDYLVEKYKSDGPRFVSKAPEQRVTSGIISNVCETFLSPMLYLYPSHTITALAGRPPVPMRSADKEKVFVDHLAQLDILEGYASRQGPYLTGKSPAVCDAFLFPFFVYYVNYCHRLSKVLFDRRPKLEAWFSSMLDDPVVQSIVRDLDSAVLDNVNRSHNGKRRK